MSNPKILTRPEAAAHCRVSLGSFDTHVRPELVPVRIGRRVLFRLDDLDEWLAAGKVAETLGRDHTPRVSRTTQASAPVVLGAVGLAIRNKLRSREGR